ncbi:glutamate--tRNA ligase [bacterium]|nr:glutamate--tRNA ligase [bacterium]
MTDNERLAELIFPNIKTTIEDLEKKYPKRNLPDNAIVDRFAPSPTGFLHSGSLFTAMICHKFQKQTNGVFMLRLEDTDSKREIEGSGERLLSELALFDIIPTEGYYGSYEKGNYGPYKQSDRSLIYNTVIKEMIKRGDAYPCFLSEEELNEIRKEQELKKENPGYYGKYALCSFMSAKEAIERIEKGDKYIIRFRSHGNHNNKIHVHDLIKGDLELTENDQHIVILKSDGLPTYHFAHLCDDHFMHTTHVTRGEEWLSSLPIHIELFERLGFPLPKYAHLPVIMKLDDGKRRKLSKRLDKEAAVSYFLESGYPKKALLEYLFTLANSNFEEWRLEHMDSDIYDFDFTFDKFSVDGALFDIEKINNISKERLSRLSKKEFTDLALEYASLYNKELESLILRDRPYFESIINIEREKENPRKDYTKFEDIVPFISFFYDDYYDSIIKDNPFEFNPKYSTSEIKEVLNAHMMNLGLDLTEEEWFNNLKSVMKPLGFAANKKEMKEDPEFYKGTIGDASEMIRIVLAGRKNSPNLYYVEKILGKDKIINRFSKVE